MSNIRQGFVYILHFDDPLGHARHYIGSTGNLLRRLTAHANGAGSALTREACRRGLRWRLGALGVSTWAAMRRNEREVKVQRNAERYCGLCHALPARIKGTRPYPLDVLPFPTSFEELHRSPLALPHAAQVFRCQDRVLVDKSVVMAEILRLMQVERDCLGFIPAGGEQGLEVLWAENKIVLAFLGDRFVGYCVFTVERFGTQANIMQIVVKDEARGYNLGAEMLAQVVASGAYMAITAKVRVDLTANEFWMHQGFALKGTVTHKSSGGRLNHYVKWLGMSQGEATFLEPGGDE